VAADVAPRLTTRLARATAVGGALFPCPADS
jgi:hypothetical protein